jgi:nucleotidyltransferase substrate binding protein (TIGR01987 family)
MFEFTFELAWKTLRDLLVFEGHQVTSPREAIRVAFAAGLLGDAGLWLAALESRNRLSHTYDEQTAAEAEALIKNAYAPLVAALVERLRHKRSNP